MVYVWKSAKYVKFVVKTQVRGNRPSVLFVRRLTFIFRRVVEGVLSVLPTLSAIPRREKRGRKFPIIVQSTEFHFFKQMENTENKELVTLNIPVLWRWQRGVIV